jgi:hypothetical protein
MADFTLVQARNIFESYLRDSKETRDKSVAMERMNTIPDAKEIKFVPAHTPVKELSELLLVAQFVLDEAHASGEELRVKGHWDTEDSYCEEDAFLDAEGCMFRATQELLGALQAMLDYAEGNCEQLQFCKKS